MRSAAPPAWAVRSTRTWLPPGILRLTSPGSPASHVPVNLHAHSPRRLTHFPPKIARRCGLAPWQEVCHFHPHSRPRGPTALAEVETRACYELLASRASRKQASEGSRRADLGPLSGWGPWILRLATARKVHNRL